MPIERTDVGAWLLKGDPDSKWDYWGAIEEEGVRPGDVRITDWSLGKTYRNSLIEKGDLVALYLGGSTGAIVEIGVITSGMSSMDVWDEQHVIDPDELRKVRPFCEYRAVLLRQPIARATLKQDSILSGSEVVRLRQLTNPSYLTPGELEALVRHLGKADLQDGGWTDSRLRSLNPR